MSRTRRIVRTVATVACGAVLLAATACGGDSGKDDKSAPASTAPVTAAPTTAPASTPTTVLSAVDKAWRTTANELGKETGETAEFACPAGGFVLEGQLWGTTEYTDDSRICPAAVHAGVITAADGGTVTIRFVEGRESYGGSTEHGVTSDEYGPWSGGFVFVR